MSSSGGKSSPGSLTGASSADATVMTMPTGSQLSGDGGVAPLETTSAGSNVRMGNAIRVMKRFSRSTSPRTTTRRSPKRDIETVETEDAKDSEELRSARVSYQYLNDEYSCLHDGYTRLYAESQEEFPQLTRCNMAMNTHLQEMVQEDEGATVRIAELQKKLRLAESLADHIYTKYEELAHENHEEHSQFDEVRSKMEDMTGEM